jgi:catechol 2,3-dioxygenase-like lactoylglutathione lyase family enzyme
MADSTTITERSAAARSSLIPRMLNHAAWVTHDVAATADFYTRIMGMEIAATVLDDKVPSTGDPFPYFHVFFRMADGSTMAFFEAPGLPAAAASTHPAYEVFNHFALEAASPQELRRWHSWLSENDVEVLGPIDHNGQILSIYFHDPNGLRLEIAAPLNPSWNQRTDQGQADLAAWIEVKERARREGRDVVRALNDFIRIRREERRRDAHQ